MAMTAANGTSVSIQDLSLNFGAVSVLQTLNLDVAEGEFIVLLGPSGCGKSTLLNCIAGLLDISDGRIFIRYSLELTAVRIHVLKRSATMLRNALDFSAGTPLMLI